MCVISFHFAQNMDREQQGLVLNRLKVLEGVCTTGYIDPKSEDQDISRMCFAESINPHHVPFIVDELRRTNGVEGVSTEPKRTTTTTSQNTTRSKSYKRRAEWSKDCPHLDKIISKINFSPMWEQLVNTKPRDQFLIITPKNILKDLAIFGDVFIELVTSPDGKLVATQSLTPETVFRIQTTKGKLVEFQQTKSSPDYKITEKLLPYEIRSEYDIIRFSPEMLLHFTINTVEIKHPYGTGVYDTRRSMISPSYEEMEKLVVDAAKEMDEKIAERLAVNYNQIQVTDTIKDCIKLIDTNTNETKSLLKRLLNNLEIQNKYR